MIPIAMIDPDPGMHRQRLKTMAALLVTPWMLGYEAKILASTIDAMGAGLEQSLADGLMTEWEAEGIAARFRRAAESLQTWPRSTLAAIAHLPAEANFFNPSWFDHTNPEAYPNMIDSEGIQ